MHWLYSAVVGLGNGVLGAALAAFVADGVMAYRNVSNFEGTRGYLICFLVIPPAFLVSLGIGIWAAHHGPDGFLGWAKHQGIALLVTASIMGIVGGFSYLTAEHPPKSDGKKLQFQFEMRIPAGPSLPTSAGDLGVAASLRAGAGESRGAFLHPESARQEENGTIIPGDVLLYDTAANRALHVSFRSATGETMPTQGFVVPLPARPGKESFVWSDWIGPSASLEPLPDASLRCEMRCRVQQIGEE